MSSCATFKKCRLVIAPAPELSVLKSKVLKESKSREKSRRNLNLRALPIFALNMNFKKYQGNLNLMLVI